MRRLLCLLFAGLFASCSLAANISVVTSIAPIQAWVAAVMVGVDTPSVLVPPGASPHTYALKPSAANALSNANLIFWVGPSLETFLQKTLSTPELNAKVITLLDTPRLHRLAPRHGGVWETDDDETHLPKNLARYEQIDPHIWLDPHNAQIVIPYIAQVLSQKDPMHAAIYQKNAKQAVAQLKILDNKIAILLKPVQTQPFVVFHDAYQYFSAHYGLNVVGSMVIEPGEPVSAKRVLFLRNKIQALKAKCIFREPQFDSNLMDILLKDTQAHEGVLDPLGPGQTLAGYEQGMLALAMNLKRCLG